MTILVHPTLIGNEFALKKLLRTADLEQETTAHTFRLVPKKSKPQRVVDHTILLQCSYCQFKDNMHLRGETCTRCNVGRMFDPWNGGSAA